jgi:hypothetical protein
MRLGEKVDSSRAEASFPKIVEIRDAAGAIRYEERIDAPWGTSEPLVSQGGIWAYGQQTVIVPEEDLPLGPEQSFEEDYRTIFTPERGDNVVLHAASPRLY